MTSAYIVISLVVGLLLLCLIILGRLLREEEGCRSSSGCTRNKCSDLPEFLTSKTPATLSLQEINQGGFLELIKRHSSDPQSVVVEGVEGIQVTLPELLNVLTQKVIQHEAEIGEMVKVMPKKRTRKAAAKKKTTSKKK